MHMEANKLLIAEDNEIDLFLLRRALDETGFLYNAEIATNGQDALLLLHRPPQNFTGIILDLNLVTHTGIQILAQIREIPTFVNTAVVILTSSSSPKDRRTALSLGASAVLVKPLDLDEWTDLGRQIKDLFSLPDASNDRSSPL